MSPYPYDIKSAVPMSISRVIDSDARYANDTVSRIRLLEKSSISYTKQARWIGLEPLVLWKHVSFIKKVYYLFRFNNQTNNNQQKTK